MTRLLLALTTLLLTGCADSLQPSGVYACETMGVAYVTLYLSSKCGVFHE